MSAVHHSNGKALAGKQEGAARASLRDIPTFSLYGEAASATGAEFVHIEDIQSRSERHNWEIDAHTHRGLFQIVAVEAAGSRPRHPLWSPCRRPPCMPSVSSAARAATC